MKLRMISYHCAACFERYRTEHDMEFDTAQVIATSDELVDLDNGEIPPHSTCAKCGGQTDHTLSAPLVMRAAHRDGIRRFDTIKETRKLDRELRKMTMKQRKSTEDASRLKAEIKKINTPK